jgi:hypothetical protein
VVLLGGEPGLFPSLIHRLTNATRDLGIDVRIETNGSWATTDVAAHKFLDPLAKAGARIMLSVDAFHEPFVPLDSLERAIQALDELEMEYVIEVPYIDYPDAQHPLDVKTEEILRHLEMRLDRKPCARIAKGPVYFKGRAAHRLAPHVANGRGIPYVVCERVPWWTNGSQSTTELLGLNPEGYLSKECGIAIGNVRIQTVEEILSTFDAECHPILSTLIHRGPIVLAKEAEEIGYVMKTDYADKCHLCQEAREALRSRYPQYLVPVQQYEDKECPV